MDIDLALVLDHQGVTGEVASPTVFPEKRGTTGGMKTVQGNLGNQFYLLFSVAVLELKDDI